MDNIHNEPKSIEAIAFRDTLFAYNEENKTYLVKSLLVLGFLYCRFESESQNLDELWMLVNPEKEN